MKTNYSPITGEEQGARHIVLGEDDAMLARMLTILLRREGYSVSKLEDGKQVLECVLHHETTAGLGVDLLICDVNMPGIQGSEVIRHLRELQIGIPVLMVSGDNEEEMDDYALEQGADAFLGKPFYREELLATVRSLLNTKSAGVAHATA